MDTGKGEASSGVGGRRWPSCSARSGGPCRDAATATTLVQLESTRQRALALLAP